MIDKGEEKQKQKARKKKTKLKQASSPLVTQRVGIPAGDPLVGVLVECVDDKGKEARKGARKRKADVHRSVYRGCVRAIIVA